MRSHVLLHSHRERRRFYELHMIYHGLVGSAANLKVGLFPIHAKQSLSYLTKWLDPAFSVQVGQDREEEDEDNWETAWAERFGDPNDPHVQAQVKLLSEAILAQMDTSKQGPGAKALNKFEAEGRLQTYR